MDIRTPDDVHTHVADLASILTEPRDDECVLCYVDRMLDAFGCDTTLRWARRWRDLRRPRATGLERRLRSCGGFCDCEVFLNGWTLRDDLCVVGDGDGDEDGELTWPAERPSCAGITSTSSRPCANWRPWRRR